ncbi:MAG: hypothetical protein DSY85_16355 [Marinomonas sp.]|nr:MAG: hypothetical protein DSY85_16355 [Marinomonas sp.]
MPAFGIAVLLVAIVFFLTKLALTDIKTRQVRHRDLLCLMALILVLWIEQPNYQILPYTLAILGVGFLLHIFKILGAGDTKLLCVISLGVTPEFISLLLYGTVFLGGLFAIAYLIYGYCTDLARVRVRGVPYAVPISIVGGAMISLTYIS